MIRYRLTGCAADADDFVQDTFVRTIHRGRPLNDPLSIRLLMPEIAGPVFVLYSE